MSTQSTMPFNKPLMRNGTNVIQVAFEKFSPKVRPPCFEAALKDPVFSRLLKARAAQLVKQLPKQSELEVGNV